MKKLLWKLTLFCLPLLLVSAAATLLPLNFFTFKLWEALVVRWRNPLLSGPFYPSRRMAMVEEGDLGHGTRYAIRRNAIWETDRYGFRAKERSENPEIVVVGDSYIVGTSLSQDETFAERLRQQLGRSVYPYAPKDLNSFLRDARFAVHPPKVVIFEDLERNMLRLGPLRLPKRLDSAGKLQALAPLAVTLDRMIKQEPVNYLRARLTSERIGVRYRGIFFYQGENATMTAAPGEVSRMVGRLKEYSDYFRRRGIRFIFLPIPNKETVYYDYLPSKRRPRVLEEVLNRVAESGVDVIDSLRPFQTARAEGVAPFQPDDTHWSPAGVDIAVRLIAQQLNQSETGPVQALSATVSPRLTAAARGGRSGR
ncbi:alginate O-acetyltransferase AlgX-related protein [Geomesophilobacter sediminis]|uniref:AlgX/AlgJ SGNH hydrolase-like domain-containing protein n=1 Tax=Geomesophilobacter sediminis TaxID=2798584 RepID=A0A8J7JEE2_9BACT|nr:hypothetical protein [Geomesophilobacter sediminis]MBJ6725948.1 hypothetical protein [Geomesophilobacter sediminis]